VIFNLNLADFIMNKNKRHRHYINPAIQKQLIIALLVVEVLLICVTVLWLYHDMSQLIETNMFRIHIQNTLSVEFFTLRLLQVASVLLIVNVLLASVTVWYWRNNIERVIAPIDHITELIKKLDFTTEPEVFVQDKATQAAAQWFKREKNKLIEVRKIIAEIDMQAPKSADEILSNCQRILKKAC